MINYHLDNSKAQLKYLFELSDSKNDTLLIQAMQSLEILEHELKIETVGNSNKIVQLLTQELINIYTDFLCHTSFQSINLCWASRDLMSVDTLLKIIEVLPSFLKVVKYFKFGPNSYVSIGEREVSIRGCLLDEQNFEQFKTEIYYEMRKLLSLHSFLTYEISRDNTISLKCTLDNPIMGYYIKFKCSSSMSAVLPSIVSKFETSNPPDFPHLCLEITDDLRLIKHQGISQNITKTPYVDDKVIFHFPFVFRPLSLIIPIKGQIMPLNGNKSDEDTGSVFPRPVKIDLFQHFRSS